MSEERRKVTWWYTPDGDGWEDRDVAISTYRENHGGDDPKWVQRIDETIHPQEQIERGGDE